VDDERRGFTSGFAAYVLWGLLTLYWHELTGLDAFGLIAWRIVWSVIALAIVLTVVKRWSGIGAALGRRRLLPTTVAATALTVNWTTYVWCVTHDRVVDTALGYFLSPIGLVIAGVVAFHEPLRRAQVGALALCGVAVVVLAVGYGSPPYLALLIAVTWTVYGVAKKRVTSAPVEGLMAETLVLAPIAIVVLLAMQPSGGSLEGASTLQYALIPLTGVVTITPLLLFAYAAHRVKLTTLGWLQYWVPTINLVLGVAVYDESMPAWRAAGFALVWIALALITLDGLRAARSGSATGTPPPVETEPVPLEG
jgi:chloramphenicol-sensitive protein RarD